MRLLALCLLAVGSVLPTVVVAADDDGFASLFDGKTLNGWDGNPDFWSVQDGAITGQTTKENPTQGNTFLVYRGAEFKNFELKFEYKIVGGNSGIQYRSFEPDRQKQKWVVGGYQADLEAGNTFSGILYGERFRGMLANRGQKTELVRENGKFKSNVVGSVGDSAEIQSKIKKEDWNEYSVLADGFHFVHKINGVTTAECTDLDEQQRRDSGIIALQLHAGPPMLVQFRNIRIKNLDQAAEPANKGTKDKTSANSGDKKKIVFISGRPSHGYGSHEHYAGCRLLASSLEEAMPNYDVKVIKHGWPADGVKALEGADTVIVYCDGGGRHLLNPPHQRVRPLNERGCGTCLHSLRCGNAKR